MTAHEIFDVIALVHRPHWHEGAVLVMACYLDDSDTVGSSVATIAGYIASAENWKRLEDHLDEVCKRYGVGILHAKEFHDTKGDFKNWSALKKMRFIDDLYANAKLITFGISSSCSKAWSEIKKQHKAHAQTSLYRLMFSNVVLTLTFNNPLAAHIRGQGISFLVESGHNNNADIEQYFHKVRTQKNYEGCLKSLSFVSKDSSRAIQLADFLAFHSRRHAALYAARGSLIVPKNKILHRIQTKVPHLETIADKITDFRKIGSMDDFIEMMKSGKNPAPFQKL